jgi:hypothetical protein
MSTLLTNFRDLPNIGVIEVKVPEDVMAVLTTSIKKMMSENFISAIGYQENLVGHLEKEFLLDQTCRDVLEPLVVEVGNMYENRWNYASQVDNGVFTSTPTLALQNLWVNFQKKHEFNPTHTHTGIYSFVIWMRIPYHLEDEENNFPAVKGTAQKTSRFTFHYNNILGMNSAFSLPVDQGWEGTMLFFPAALTHSVYPFYTSDEYRISIAGNLKPNIKL